MSTYTMKSHNAPRFTDQSAQEKVYHLGRLARAAEKQKATVMWADKDYPVVNGEDIRDLVSFDPSATEMAIGDPSSPVAFHIKNGGVFDYSSAARRLICYIGRLHVLEETIRAEFLAALDGAVEKLNASTAAGGGDEAKQVRRWRLRVERYLDQAMAMDAMKK